VPSSTPTMIGRTSAAERHLGSQTPHHLTNVTARTTAGAPIPVAAHRLAAEGYNAERVYHAAQTEKVLADAVRPHPQTTSYMIIAAWSFSAGTSECAYGDGPTTKRNRVTTICRRVSPSSVEYSVANTPICRRQEGTGSPGSCHNDGRGELHAVDAPLCDAIPMPFDTMIEHSRRCAASDLQSYAIRGAIGGHALPQRGDSTPQRSSWPPGLRRTAEYGATPSDIPFDSPQLNVERAFSGETRTDGATQASAGRGAKSFVIPVSIYDMTVPPGERNALQ